MMSRLSRAFAFVLCVFVLAVGTLFGGIVPAAAAPPPVKAPSPCTTEQWRSPASWEDCVKKLGDLTTERVGCVEAPTPSAPDSGMAGWFASTPSNELRGGRGYRYTRYGYAGYDYSMY